MTFTIQTLDKKLSGFGMFRDFGLWLYSLSCIDQRLQFTLHLSLSNRRFCIWWSKRVPSLNGPQSKWHLNSRQNCVLSSDHHLNTVPLFEWHLNSGQPFKEHRFGYRTWIYSDCSEIWKLGIWIPTVPGWSHDFLQVFPFFIGCSVDGLPTRDPGQALIFGLDCRNQIVLKQKL